MKAVEFHSHLNPDQTLTIPAQVASLLGGEQKVRVLLLIPESSEDQEWERLTADEFLQGYAEGDSIYDKLPVG